jgi:hypothetical protein
MNSALATAGERITARMVRRWTVMERVIVIQIVITDMSASLRRVRAAPAILFAKEIGAFRSSPGL